MEDFTIDRQRTDGADVVEVRGEIDMDSGNAVGVVVQACLNDDARAVVLDYTGVSFIDSTGVGMLMRAHKRLREDGRALVIACDGASPVRRMFELTGLTQSLPLAGSRDEALRLAAATA